METERQRGKKTQRRRGREAKRRTDRRTERQMCSKRAAGERASDTEIAKQRGRETIRLRESGG